MVRRGSIHAHSDDYEFRSDIEQQPNQQSIKNQPFEKQISRSARPHGEVHEGKPSSTLEEPKNIRLNHIKETSYPNQHHPKMSTSPVPPSSLHMQKYKPTIQEQASTISNLNEVPTTSKWSTRKKVIVGISASLITATVIIVTIVLSVLLTRRTESTTTTTTVASVIVSAYWTFDNTIADSYGAYNGQLINSAGYTSSTSTSVPYVGHGQALNLVSTSSQSFLVSTSFFNLSYTSFTIEAWIYPTSLTSTVDRGIFGQCQCSACSNQCLYLIIRNSRLYIGFTVNDLSGSTTLSNSNWYHIAFVYNYETRQQILYINGVQDAIKSNAEPYQGKNGSIHIGSTQVYSTTNYFNGYIDNVFLTTKVKSSTEILRDASLMAYYSFDTPSPTIDSGPNGLNGSSTNTVIVTGRVNQAMSFLGSSSSSYFRAYGFYQIPQGTINGKSFSIALWINPSTISSFSIIQTISASSNLYQCENLLGIYSSNGLVGQLFVSSSYNGPSLMTGPFIEHNTWTHISLTYSSSNGYTLYANGVRFGATGSVSFSASGTFAQLYIGYGLSCYYGSIDTAYQGSIDELYIYNRELSQTEVTELANP
ncbi:unnamed protein product [Rotaria sp. Silwood1]|nr:unnamed protein product [Rotaria sp. Silwood1]